jgi:hypothetical protein
MSGTSSRLAIPYVQGTDAVNGYPTVSQALANRLDLNPGGTDFLQAGMLFAADWSFVATINGSTCALGSETSTGGGAWLPDPVVSGGLVRSQTALASISGLIPATKPASGKFMTVGFELTESEGKAVVSVVSGAEKSTQAEAEASSPATTAGKLRVRDVVVKNTAGTYSIVMQRDRRPWARGLLMCSFQATGAFTPTSGFKAIPELALRGEVVQPRLLLTLTCHLQVATTATLEVRVGGAGISIPLPSYRPFTNTSSAEFYSVTAVVNAEGLTRPSSKLFIPELAIDPTSGSCTVESSTFTIREFTSNNNGTS